MHKADDEVLSEDDINSLQKLGISVVCGTNMATRNQLFCFYTKQTVGYNMLCQTKKVKIINLIS